MKELWVAEAMDLLQEVVPGMTDEHAKDLADDLHCTWGDKPARLAVMRFFNVMPGWVPSTTTVDGLEMVATA